MGFTNANLDNGGGTAHFQIFYDDTFPGTLGQQAAGQFQYMCEFDFDLISGWFSGIDFKFSFPITVQIVNASGGASWQDPSDAQVFFGASLTITVNPLNSSLPGIDASYIRYLVVSEVTEMFMASQGTGWFESTSVFSGADEGSKGEGLSRFLSVQFLLANNLLQTINNPGYLQTGVPPPNHQVLQNWLNSPRVNYVDNNPDDNNPDATTGCTTCFIYYLHNQLGFSANAIIAAGASTLADVYTNLTGRTDAWNAFSTLVNEHFPPIVSGLPFTYHPVGDNLFPIPDLVDISSGLQLMSGSTINAPVFFTMSGIVAAEVTVQLSSGIPAVLTLPSTVTVTPTTTLQEVQMQAQPVTGPLINVLVSAAYAGKMVMGSVAVLPRPSVISGRVTNTALQPINEAGVGFSAASPITPTTNDSLALETGADGRYQTPDIPPQLYQVTAAAEGYAPAQASVTVGLGVPVTTLNFALAPPEPFTVKGIVWSQIGKALQGVKVTLDPPWLQATTDHSGIYVITGMPPDLYDGDYMLTATLAGYMPRSVTFTIPNGATVIKEIVIAQLGSLSGTVINAADGKPIPGATVTTGTASGVSDLTGTYSLAALDPGATDVTVSAPSFDPAQSQVWIVSGGHVVKDITMTPASAVVFGTVAAQDAGVPLANATVIVAGVGMAHTDHTGSFTISDVPAGHYEVTASAFGFRPAAVSIQVMPHVAVREDFGLFPLHEPKPVGDLPNS
jgi:hypothetical protein